MGKIRIDLPTEIKLTVSHIQCPRCGAEYLHVITSDLPDFRCERCEFSDRLRSWPAEEYINLTLCVTLDEYHNVVELTAEEDL